MAQRNDAVGKLDDLKHSTISGWQNTVRAIWKRACEHDGVDPASRFVVFSDDNPFVPFLDRARNNLREAIQEATVFGYTGLKMEGGKAVIPAASKTDRSRVVKSDG